MSSSDCGVIMWMLQGMMCALIFIVKLMLGGPWLGFPGEEVEPQRTGSGENWSLDLCSKFTELPPHTHTHCPLSILSLRDDFLGAGPWLASILGVDAR